MESSVKTADKTSQFGEDSIFKLMMRYSIPSIVAMLIQSSYNLINMSFIGRSVGPLGIAAISVCTPLNLIHSAITQCISNGCAAAVAIKLGQGDKAGSRVVLGNSIAFSMLIAAVNIILWHIFIDPILRVFGASEAILPYARDYLNITLFGMIFSCFMTMNPMMRMEGYPTRAMITMLLSAVVNSICTPTFIFVFGWGIKGAAFGTFLAQAATGAWVFFFLTNKKRVVGLEWKHFRLRPRNMLRVVQLGLPTFLMQLTQSMLSMVMNTSVGTYGGDTAISAWGITNNINNLVSQPVFGLNQGVQPIIGYNIGAKNYKRVKQALYCSIVLATVFSFLGWVLTRMFPAQIFAFFNPDPNLIAMGVRMIIVFRACIVVVGLQQAGSAYFQYSGKPRTSVFLTLSRQVIILIPCIYILSGFLGMDGILYSGPISDVVSAAITGVLLMREVKRLNRLIREPELGAHADAV